MDLGKGVVRDNTMNSFEFVTPNFALPSLPLAKATVTTTTTTEEEEESGNINQIVNNARIDGTFSFVSWIETPMEPSNDVALCFLPITKAQRWGSGALGQIYDEPTRVLVPLSHSDELAMDWVQFGRDDRRNVLALCDGSFLLLRLNAEALFQHGETKNASVFAREKLIEGFSVDWMALEQEVGGQCCGIFLEPSSGDYRNDTVIGSFVAGRRAYSYAAALCRDNTEVAVTLFEEHGNVLSFCGEYRVKLSVNEELLQQMQELREGEQKEVKAATFRCVHAMQWMLAGLLSNGALLFVDLRVGELLCLLRLDIPATSVSISPDLLSVAVIGPQDASPVEQVKVISLGNANFFQNNLAEHRASTVSLPEQCITFKLGALKNSTVYPVNTCALTMLEEATMVAVARSDFADSILHQTAAYNNVTACPDVTGKSAVREELFKKDAFCAPWYEQCKMFPVPRAAVGFQNLALSAPPVFERKANAMAFPSSMTASFVPGVKRADCCVFFFNGFFYAFYSKRQGRVFTDYMVFSVDNMQMVHRTLAHPSVLFAANNGFFLLLNEAGCFEVCASMTIKDKRQLLWNTFLFYSEELAHQLAKLNGWALDDLKDSFFDLALESNHIKELRVLLDEERKGESDDRIAALQRVVARAKRAASAADFNDSKTFMSLANEFAHIYLSDCFEKVTDSTQILGDSNVFKEISQLSQFIKELRDSETEVPPPCCLVGNATNVSLGNETALVRTDRTGNVVQKSSAESGTVKQKNGVGLPKDYPNTSTAVEASPKGVQVEVSPELGSEQHAVLQETVSRGEDLSCIYSGVSNKLENDTIRKIRKALLERTLYKIRPSLVQMFPTLSVDKVVQEQAQLLAVEMLYRLILTSCAVNEQDKQTLLRRIVGLLQYGNVENIKSLFTAIAKKTFIREVRHLLFDNLNLDLSSGDAEILAMIYRLEAKLPSISFETEYEHQCKTVTSQRFISLDSILLSNLTLQGEQKAKLSPPAELLDLTKETVEKLQMFSGDVSDVQVGYGGLPSVRQKTSRKSSEPQDAAFPLVTLFPSLSAKVPVIVGTWLQKGESFDSKYFAMNFETFSKIPVEQRQFIFCEANAWEMVDGGKDGETALRFYLENFDCSRLHEWSKRLASTRSPRSCVVFKALSPSVFSTNIFAAIMRMENLHFFTEPCVKTSALLRELCCGGSIFDVVDSCHSSAIVKYLVNARAFPFIAGLRGVQKEKVERMIACSLGNGKERIWNGLVYEYLKSRGSRERLAFNFGLSKANLLLAELTDSEQVPIKEIDCIVDVSQNKPSANDVECNDEPSGIHGFGKENDPVAFFASQQNVATPLQLLTIAQYMNEASQLEHKTVLRQLMCEVVPSEQLDQLELTNQCESMKITDNISVVEELLSNRRVVDIYQQVFGSNRSVAEQEFPFSSLQQVEEISPRVELNVTYFLRNLVPFPPQCSTGSDSEEADDILRFVLRHPNERQEVVAACAMRASWIAGIDAASLIVVVSQLLKIEPALATILEAYLFPRETCADGECASSECALCATENALSKEPLSSPAWALQPAIYSLAMKRVKKAGPLCALHHKGAKRLPSIEVAARQHSWIDALGIAARCDNAAELLRGATDAETAFDLKWYGIREQMALVANAASPGKFLFKNFPINLEQTLKLCRPVNMVWDAFCAETKFDCTADGITTPFSYLLSINISESDSEVQRMRKIAGFVSVSLRWYHGNCTVADELQRIAKDSCDNSFCSNFTAIISRILQQKDVGIIRLAFEIFDKKSAFVHFLDFVLALSFSFYEESQQYLLQFIIAYSSPYNGSNCLQQNTIVIEEDYIHDVSSSMTPNTVTANKNFLASDADAFEKTSVPFTSVESASSSTPPIRPGTPYECKWQFDVLVNYLVDTIQHLIDTENYHRLYSILSCLGKFREQFLLEHSPVGHGKSTLFGEIESQLHSPVGHPNLSCVYKMLQHIFKAGLNPSVHLWSPPQALLSELISRRLYADALALCDEAGCNTATVHCAMAQDNVDRQRTSGLWQVVAEREALWLRLHRNFIEEGTDRRYVVKFFIDQLTAATPLEDSPRDILSLAFASTADKSERLELLSLAYVWLCGCQSLYKGRKTTPASMLAGQGDSSRTCTDDYSECFMCFTSTVAKVSEDQSHTASREASSSASPSDDLSVQKERTSVVRSVLSSKHFEKDLGIAVLLFEIEVGDEEGESYSGCLRLGKAAQIDGQESDQSVKPATDQTDEEILAACPYFVQDVTMQQRTPELKIAAVTSSVSGDLSVQEGVNVATKANKSVNGYSDAVESQSSSGTDESKQQRQSEHANKEGLSLQSSCDKTDCADVAVSPLTRAALRAVRRLVSRRLLAKAKEVCTALHLHSPTLSIACAALHIAKGKDLSEDEKVWLQKIGISSGVELLGDEVLAQLAVRAAPLLGECGYAIATAQAVAFRLGIPFTEAWNPPAPDRVLYQLLCLGRDAYPLFNLYAKSLPLTAGDIGGILCNYFLIWLVKEQERLAKGEAARQNYPHQMCRKNRFSNGNYGKNIVGSGLMESALYESPSSDSPLKEQSSTPFEEGRQQKAGYSSRSRGVVPSQLREESLLPNVDEGSGETWSGKNEKYAKCPSIVDASSTVSASTTAALALPSSSSSSSSSTPASFVSQLRARVAAVWSPVVWYEFIAPARAEAADAFAVAAAQDSLSLAIRTELSIASVRAGGSEDVVHRICWSLMDANQPQLVSGILSEGRGKDFPYLVQYLYDIGKIKLLWERNEFVSKEDQTAILKYLKSRTDPMARAALRDFAQALRLYHLHATLLEEDANMLLNQRFPSGSDNVPTSREDCQSLIDASNLFLQSAKEHANEKSAALSQAALAQSALCVLQLCTPYRVVNLSLAHARVALRSATNARDAMTIAHAYSLYGTELVIPICVQVVENGNFSYFEDLLQISGLNVSVFNEVVSIYCKAEERTLDKYLERFPSATPPKITISATVKENLQKFVMLCDDAFLQYELALKCKNITYATSLLDLVPGLDDLYSTKVK